MDYFGGYDSLLKSSEDAKRLKKDFLGLRTNEKYLKNPERSYATTVLNVIFGSDSNNSNNSTRSLNVIPPTKSNKNNILSNNYWNQPKHHIEEQIQNRSNNSIIKSREFSGVAMNTSVNSDFDSFKAINNKYNNNNNNNNMNSKSIKYTMNTSLNTSLRFDPNNQTSIRFTPNESIHVLTEKENAHIKLKLDKIRQPTLMDKLKPVQSSTRNRIKY